MVHKDGDHIIFEVNGRPIRGAGKGPGGYRGINREITVRKCYAVKLEYLSLHDQLTGLYNRAFFAEEMKRLSGSRDFPITIVSADINGLKLINDTMGHSKGDALLIEIYKKADDYMYRNKFSSRNSVCSYIVDILLAALAERDRISQGHAERLAALCLKMGDRLDLHPSRLFGLDLLAWVHDLGNVGVPDSILFKETSLTGEEWDLIRQHPEKGYRIARFSPKLKRVAGLILQHHERWDGSGYPRGLRGEAIALECRIFAIADAYEAMTGGGRAYREARGKIAALTEIERYAGSQFDPILAEVFCALT